MRLNGSFAPPGDKSISHRVVLFSLLAAGKAEIGNLAPGEDVRSSVRAVKALGVRVTEGPESLTVQGLEGLFGREAAIDCGNSGTTIRLLMGILAGREGTYVLDGDASLRRRPMERVAEPLRIMGARIECTAGCSPVRITGGGLKGALYELPVASAQLKSAVLLAGLQAEGATLVGEPGLSRDHTERLLARYGASIGREGRLIKIEKSRLVMPESIHVPGDSSSAAFFLCAAAVMPGSGVTAERMLLNPSRIGFLRVLERMGVRTEVKAMGDDPELWGDVTVAYTPDLKGCEVEASEIPGLVDEVPILALTATQAKGTSVFREVGELRVKETDRLAAIAESLNILGGRVETDGNDLLVHGPTPLRAPARLDSRGDHRMAMTLRLAGKMAGSEPEILDEDCLRISYPGFQADLAGLLS